MTKPGHERPNLDNRGYPEGTLFSQFTEDAQPAAESTPETPESDQVIKPVSEIMAEHEQLTVSREQYRQELIDRNWPPGRADEEADRKFPFKTSDDVEREEKAKDAAARQRIRLERGPSVRPQRGRSGLGPTQRLNADEPAPGNDDSRRSRL